MYCAKRYSKFAVEPIVIESDDLLTILKYAMEDYHNGLTPSGVVRWTLKRL